VYKIEFGNERYVVIYFQKTTFINPFQRTARVFKGLLFDIVNGVFIELPGDQSTNSLLCFVDYNKDSKIDYLHANMYSRDSLINFYTLKSRSFVKDVYFIKFTNFIDMPLIKEKKIPNRAKY
jgi:hypothetical protein